MLAALKVNRSLFYLRDKDMITVSIPATSEKEEVPFLVLT